MPVFSTDKHKMKNNYLFKYAKLSVVAVLMSNLLFSCAPMESIPAIEETTHSEDGLSQIPLDQDIVSKNVQLQGDMNIRKLRNNILELVSELPMGTRIKIDDNYQVFHNDYRNTSGGLSRSSTGFVSPVKIIEVPPAYRGTFTEQYISQLNRTPGGLFISASAVAANEGAAGNFAVIKASTPGTGFLKSYNSNGRPKFNYTTSIKKRFSARLNLPVSPLNQSAQEKAKWTAIYNELKRAAERTEAAPKSLLYMDKAAAKVAVNKFETLGIFSKVGAWTMATQVTAVKHGFANVPCAEFQSELLRQAYARAGANLLNDFSRTKGNQLVWSSTASVTGFSNALYKAGWVPWTADKYKPMTGAFMFHSAGLSPGHTYISGGHNGQIVVDNGAPQGRDLRKTSESSINIQYKTGFFFLPPGINPQAW